jgi:hypothetical protein
MELTISQRAKNAATAISQIRKSMDAIAKQYQEECTGVSDCAKFFEVKELFLGWLFYSSTIEDRIHSLKLEAEFTRRAGVDETFIEYRNSGESIAMSETMARLKNAALMFDELKTDNLYREIRNMRDVCSKYIDDLSQKISYYKTEEKHARQQ